MKSTVRVLRSHDDYEFEIQLEDEAEDEAATNALRQTAARLADEAVRQHKVMLEQKDTGRNFDYESDPDCYYTE